MPPRCAICSAVAPPPGWGCRLGEPQEEALVSEHPELALLSRRGVLMMIALVLAELTCSLESGMLYVALSDLYRDYGDPISVGWLLTAFTLTSAASAAVAGRLGDLFGRRRILLFMLALAFFGSALSAMTNNLAIIIVGRAIQGVSMAVLPLSFGVLCEIIAKRDMGLAISAIGATYAVGGGLGVIIGGVIVDKFDWHGIFIVSAGLALVSIVMVLLLVPRVATRAARNWPARAPRLQRDPLRAERTDKHLGHADFAFDCDFFASHGHSTFKLGSI